MPLNLAQRSGLRKCDMGNWVAREGVIVGFEWADVVCCAFGALGVILVTSPRTTKVG